MLEEMEESRFRGTLRNNRALDIAIFISLYSLVQHSISQSLLRY